MIAAIQLLKERPVTREQRLAAEFHCPVEFEISINRRDEGMCQLFANDPASNLDPVLMAQRQ